MASNLENYFLNILVPAYKLPTPVSEYKFLENRRFRFDFAYPAQKIAIELEGGVYTQGRHTRGKGYESDLEKYNLATVNGWKILRFTSGMLNQDPDTHIKQIITLLN